MKKIKLSYLFTLFGLFVSLNAVSDPEMIRNKLAKTMPGLEISDISPAPVKGFYEVVVGPNLFYVSEDGKHLFNGNLFDLEAVPENRDLTESKIAMARVKAVQKIGQDNVIKFKAPMEKHTVSVFTDVDCGYCRKLHAEIDEYMKQGISIDYLFFPRAGQGSDSYKKAVAVWCADDRQDALTKAKQGEALEMKECANPVAEHMKLAGSLQIRGTPMIVTESGVVLPGYVSAKDLSKTLEKSDTGSKN